MSELIGSIATEIYTPVAFLLILGGLFFLVYSRFIQYKYFSHAISILRGKYHNPNDPGQISPYEALSTALASTVGMGNIAGVAFAISVGGPGALFWMWVTAFIGMTTNFFTSTLSVMYRGKDSNGEIQGGPMYVIQEALGKSWRPLAILFCLCCMVGTLPIFQANQLSQAIVDIGISSEEVKAMTFSFLGIQINTLNPSNNTHHHIGYCYYWRDSAYWKLGRKNGSLDDCALFLFRINNSIYAHREGSGIFLNDYNGCFYRK